MSKAKVCAALAAQLDGREYGEEISNEEEAIAKADGLVVLFGASDDLAEFRGAIHDEAGCYDGGEILIATINGELKILETHECECEFCGFKEIANTAKKIISVWDDDSGYPWRYETDIPHATFDILEYGVKYCKGIIFSVKDLA